jgi:ABC-type phosphate transport system substrate-binding protein
LHIWLVVASVSLVFFGVGEGIWHYGSGFVPVPPPSSGPPHCVRSRITIPGSTALYALALEMAANYMHYCNAIHIPTQITVVDTAPFSRTPNSYIQTSIE